MQPITVYMEIFTSFDEKHFQSPATSYEDFKYSISVEGGLYSVAPFIEHTIRIQHNLAHLI